MTKQEYNKLQELFSEEELNALALGFPIAEDFDLNFSGEIEDEDEYEDFNFMDDYSDSENEFDNFFTKKARDRRKKRKALRKSGLSRKEARKQALKDIPRDTIKKALKKVSINNIKKDARGLFRGVAKVTGMVPRQAYLTLVRTNVRGYAYKLNAVLKNSSLKARLKKRWEKLGGDWNKLVGAINVGRQKKANICGKKCQAKQLEYKNLDPIVTGSLVTLAGGIVTALASIVNQAKVTDTENKEIEAEKEKAENENKTLTEVERMRLEAERKRIEAQSDPRKMILNNPDLSPEEKKFALAEYDKVLGTENKRKLIKYGVIGGIALIGIIVAFKVIKRRKK